MYQPVSHIAREPEPEITQSTIKRVSIDPSGLTEEVNPQGTLNLFPQASRIFGQLEADNVFTGSRNVFHNVEVRRMHVTSDQRHKQNIEVIDPRLAADLVRTVMPRRYLIDGRPAAGMLANDLCAARAHTTAMESFWGGLKKVA